MDSNALLRICGRLSESKGQMKFVFARRELTSMPIMGAAHGLMIEAETMVFAYVFNSIVIVPFQLWPLKRVEGTDEIRLRKKRVEFNGHPGGRTSADD